jgi:hypothetical protein
MMRLAEVNARFQILSLSLVCGYSVFESGVAMQN